MPINRFTAHGKLIVVGEHAVVDGYPAVVSQISLEASCHITEAKVSQIFPDFIDNALKIFAAAHPHTIQPEQLNIRSEIPIGSGLGSSAAIACAIFLCLARELDVSLSQEQLYQLVQKSEHYAHGNPSGIDAAAVVYGGLLAFTKNNKGVSSFSIDHTALHSKKFFLIQSGIPRENTKEMIQIAQKHPDKKILFSNIGEIATQCIRGLQEQTFDPDLLSENHRILYRLGVVGRKAKMMIDLIHNQQGAAKISGAGGVSDGSGMILAYHPDEGALLHLIQHHGWQHYEVFIGAV